MTDEKARMLECSADSADSAGPQKSANWDAPAARDAFLWLTGSTALSSASLATWGRPSHLHYANETRTSPFRYAVHADFVRVWRASARDWVSRQSAFAFRAEAIFEYVPSTWAGVAPRRLLDSHFERLIAWTILDSAVLPAAPWARRRADAVGPDATILRSWCVEMDDWRRLPALFWAPGFVSALPCTALFWGDSV